MQTELQFKVRIFSEKEIGGMVNEACHGICDDDITDFFGGKLRCGLKINTVCAKTAVFFFILIKKKQSLLHQEGLFSVSVSQNNHWRFFFF